MDTQIIESLNQAHALFGLAREAQQKDKSILTAADFLQQLHEHQNTIRDNTLIDAPLLDNEAGAMCMYAFYLMYETLLREKKIIIN